MNQLKGIFLSLIAMTLTFGAMYAVAGPPKFFKKADKNTNGEVTVTFRGDVTTAEGSQDIDTDIEIRQEIPIFQELNEKGWHCSISPRFLKDGMATQSIACVSPDAIVVGMTVICSLNEDDADITRFNLFSKQGKMTQFVLGCKTDVRKTSGRF